MEQCVNNTIGKKLTSGYRSGQNVGKPGEFNYYAFILSVEYLTFYAKNYTYGNAIENVCIAGIVFWLL